MNFEYRPVHLRRYIKYKLGMTSAYTQTSENEQECLKRYAADRKRLVEIGVFEGVNTRNFRAAMNDQGVIIAVDPYPRHLFGLLGFGWIRRIAHREVSKIKRGQVIWVEDLGKFASSKMEVKPYLPVDFLFIDGDHSYEGIKGDWEAWHDKVDSGGIIALHDSVNCNQANVGSEIFTKEFILKDSRFTFLEAVDTLTVIRKN